MMRPPLPIMTRHGARGSSRPAAPPLHGPPIGKSARDALAPKALAPKALAPKALAPLSREVKFAGAPLSHVDPDGSFEGYASLFGVVDLGKDLVEAGAFAESIKRRGPQGVKLLWSHDPGEPIGTWEIIREDLLGLKVRGQLNLDVARAREVHSLMKSGAIDGLSIGFKTVEARRDPRSGIRRLSRIDLWEVSLVTFPMLPQARVSTVKRAALEPRRARSPAPDAPPVGRALRAITKATRLMQHKDLFAHD
jgi:uncharacterized protein